MALSRPQQIFRLSHMAATVVTQWFGYSRPGCFLKHLTSSYLH